MQNRKGPSEDGPFPGEILWSCCWYRRTAQAVLNRTSIAGLPPQHWPRSDSDKDLESGVNADPHAITLLFGSAARCRGKGSVTERCIQAGGDGVFRTNTSRLVFVIVDRARFTLGIEHMQHNRQIIRSRKVDLQFLAGLLVISTRLWRGLFGGLYDRAAKLAS